MIHPRKKDGFTLIEMLIVIAVIAILMAMGLAVIGTSKNRANRAAVTGMLRNFYLGLESYKNEFGYYPEPVTLQDASGNDVTYIIINGPAGYGGPVIVSPQFRKHFSYTEDSVEAVELDYGTGSGQFSVLVDPFGMPYVYMMTKDLEDVPEVYAPNGTQFYNSSTNPDTINNSIYDIIFIYSYGPDGLYDVDTNSYWSQSPPNPAEDAGGAELEDGDTGYGENNDNIYIKKGVQ